MRRFAIVITVAFASAACGPQDAQPTETESAAEGPHAHAHDHEQRHDTIPRTVEISDEVLARAGVTTTRAERRVLHPTVRLPGEIVAVPELRTTISARIDGVVETVEVQPGDEVSEGDLLATIRAPNLESLRATAKALKARAAAARANAERLDALVERRMASRQEAVAANAEAEALRAEARGARARLKALDADGGGGAVIYGVRALAGGVVLERAVDVGSVVLPETRVAKVVSTRRVWFSAHLFERDVSRVETNSPATVRLNAYPDSALPGRVEYVSHQVDPGARTLSARIPLENADGRLRLGLFGIAQVQAAGDTTEPVVAVPNGAISRIADRPVVFVRQDDGHFERHDVVLGRSDTQHTEIVHGVRAGEQVVNEGAFTVKSVLLRDSFAEEGH